MRSTREEHPSFSHSRFILSAIHNCQTILFNNIIPIKLIIYCIFIRTASYIPIWYITTLRVIYILLDDYSFIIYALILAASIIKHNCIII